MAKLHKYKKPAGPANVLVVNVDGERKRIWLGYNKLPIKVKNKLLTLADELESYRNQIRSWCIVFKKNFHQM